MGGCPANTVLGRLRTSPALLVAGEKLGGGFRGVRFSVGLLLESDRDRRTGVPLGGLRGVRTLDSMQLPDAPPDKVDGFGGLLVTYLEYLLS